MIVLFVLMWLFSNYFMLFVEKCPGLSFYATGCSFLMLFIKKRCKWGFLGIFELISRRNSKLVRSLLP